MRTNPEENTKLGQIMAERLNQSKGPTAVFFPLKGYLSLILRWRFLVAWANEALLNALKENLRKDIPLIEVDANINDAEFAKAVTDKMFEFYRKDNLGGGVEMPFITRTEALEKLRSNVAAGNL